MAKEQPVYTGPSMTLESVQTLYSDSGDVKIRLNAPIQEQYENGNWEFPKGIFVEFFEEEKVITSTLKANQARYIKSEDIFIASGDVVIKNLIESKKLSTEELNWKPSTQKIFTDKFVIIETPKEILKGQGLEANQSFSDYRILKPTGIFSIKDPTSN